jgi:hypothetical protein
MIVWNDHFLNDESMLKAMLRVFEKRIARTSDFRSISWIVFFLSFRRKTRNVWVCTCVCMCLFVCSKRKIRIKNVVCEKNLSFVEFKDFCLLRSILELIIRSLVNIKKKRRGLLRWQNSKIRVYICASLQVTENLLYSLLYSFKSQIILSYFNFNCYSFYFLKFFEIYFLCFSSFYLVKTIAFNNFSFESYNVHNFTLIIDECKKMIWIARYMIQRKFANFMIKRQHAINKRLKQVWSWIKNDKVWKEFEKDYSNIVSLIRRVRDFIKLNKKSWFR